ncbi:MAG: lysophospholipid acyltransferase family protein [Desulfosarcina sp.]|nr:lysophospholipid acyltransferase family protein [Desulfobacterales bacterium]
MQQNNQSFRQPELIRLTPWFNRPGLRLVQWLLEPLILNLTGGRRINTAYRQTLETSPQIDFFEKCLRQLKIDPQITARDRERLPAKGPLIVVANHPFGGLDGIILGAVLNRLRADVKILGNHLLGRIREIEPQVIPLDVFNPQSAAVQNSRAMMAAVRWVRRGGCLASFPAGEVSRLSLAQGRIQDRNWSRHVASILRLSKATVVPVYFHGRNSTWFQMASLIHPLLGTAMLPREIMNKSDRPVKVLIGKPRPWKKLAHYQNDEDLSDYLRRQTYFLANRIGTKNIPSLPPHVKRRKRPEKIIPPVPLDPLKAEIASLPEEQELVRHGSFSVYVARAAQIPHLLKEIGRLREVTFRAVGEGTGRALDLDLFDEYYRHLFLWQRENHEIAGGYRLGLTDRIIDAFGPQGLYTSTLFRFKPPFLQALDDAIELGRSFISPAYQRHHACLFLLWRGIGNFILDHPRYKKLFGPVSISQNYQEISRDLMVYFLREQKMDRKLAQYVSPRRPVRLQMIRGLRPEDLQVGCADIETVSILISELEEDGKGLPVLLKHYLKLEANLLSFNLDKDFSNVIDGLILLDLTRTNARMVERVMGAAGFRRFRAYHDRKANREAYRLAG